jgi:hypothetical protein
MNALHNPFLLLLLVFLNLSTVAFSQVISEDSVQTAIQQQRSNVLLEEARLKAKQDSLTAVKLKLEEAAEAARKSSTVAPVVAPSRAPQTIGKVIIGLNPTHFLVRSFEMSLEMVVSKRSSLMFTGAYHSMDDYNRYKSSYSSSSNSSSTGGSPGSMFLTDQKVAYSGVKFQLLYNSYIFKDYPVLAGLHIGPYVMYKQDEATKANLAPYTSYPSSSTYLYSQHFAQALGAGIDIGYQMKLLRYFTIHPFVGFGMIVPLSGKDDASEVNIDLLNPYKEGLSLRTGIWIGYIF